MPGARPQSARESEETASRAGAAPRTRPLSARRAGAEIPGYGGYIPCKADDFGRTFRAANEQAATKLEDLGSRPQSPGGRQQAPHFVAQRALPPQAPATLESRAGGTGTGAIPGYRGFIPGKVSENVIGKTYWATNERAASEFHGTQTGQHRHAWRRFSGPGVASRRCTGAAPGIEIPGYTGYVPGKHPEAEMHGRVFAALNRHADNVAAAGRRAVPNQSAPLIQGSPRVARRPSNPHEAYLMTHSHNRSWATDRYAGAGDSGSRGNRPSRTPSKRSTSSCTSRRHSAGMSPRPGANIPGYAGHIQGTAENVHGRVFAVANQLQSAAISAR